ncbi:MAG: hypothetical protein ACR2PT_15795 [Endozoicomonas sp.]
MNKYLKHCFLTVLLLTAGLSVQAEVLIEGSLRTLDVEGDSTILNVVPGQVVRMDWQLGSDSWFTSPPLMPHWQADGAVIIPSSQEEGNFSRRSGRTTFSGVNRYYWVVPEKTGAIRITPHEVWLTRAFETEAQRYNTPGLTLRVAFPKDGSPTERFFPASDVELEQSLSSIEELGVGDQVVRKITVSADETLGSLIPAMDAIQSAEGIQGYLESTEVSNRTVSRGQLAGGQRTETWVYRLDQGGEITLPAVELVWWDLQHKQYKSATLPEVTLEVAETAVAGEEAVLRRSRLMSIPVVLSLIALFLMAALAGYNRQHIINVSTAIIKATVTSSGWVDFVLLYSALSGRKTSVQKRYLQWKRLNSAHLSQEQLPDSLEPLLLSRLAMICRIAGLVMTLRTLRWQRKHSRYLPGLND